MPDDKPRSFWSTLPGLMTGLAALLSALTGVYLAVERTRDRDTATPPTPLAAVTATSTPPAPAAAVTATTTPAPSAVEPVVLFENGNPDGVLNGPSQPTRFTIDRPHHIDDIRTYHWNGGQGASPRTISLVGADGTRYGPWEASASSGQGGASNVNWAVRPGITLPAGTYTIIDGGPESWSHNSGSGNAGFAFVRGRAVE